MCITVDKASMAKTKILSLVLENGNHFLAYSNTVKNLSGKPNAMILPIPGKTNPSMFHNTESYKGFMDEIIKKCDFRKNYLGIASKGLSRSIDLSFEEFQLGQYTIGLSESFLGVKEFIQNLSENKRPIISEELQKFFEEKYAGWSFAICVFDSDKTIDAQPIALEYIPFEGGGLLYFPTMDGHDGLAPNLDEMVDTDHTFIYEHTGKMEPIEGKVGRYSKTSVTLEANVPEFLKERKYRAETLSGKHKNGDTFIDIEKMTNSNFYYAPDMKRINPVPYVVA